MAQETIYQTVARKLTPDERRTLWVEADECDTFADRLIAALAEPVPEAGTTRSKLYEWWEEPSAALPDTNICYYYRVSPTQEPTKGRYRTPLTCAEITQLANPGTLRDRDAQGFPARFNAYRPRVLLTQAVLEQSDMPYGYPSGESA